MIATVVVDGQPHVVLACPGLGLFQRLVKCPRLAIDADRAAACRAAEAKKLLVVHPAAQPHHANAHDLDSGLRIGADGRGVQRRVAEIQLRARQVNAIQPA